MIFRCKNCNGNMIYSPERGKMLCPYCDGEDTEESIAVPNVTVCPNCGGEITVNDVTSASKCEYCGSYLIFDERVSGEFTPHLILPFKLGKEYVKQIMKREFGKKIFAPDDFLSEVKLSTMEGMYVPFWMYDFDTHYEFQGNGTKVRTWTSGNREYTETSYFNVIRDIDASFSRIPVDASNKMENGIMDLMEPYHYAQLEVFKEKYMSGFFAEKYNQSVDELEPRARQKATDDSNGILSGSISGYAKMTPIVKNLSVTRKNTEYALLPVWTYTYKYNNQIYPFEINGQTGKIIGSAPISKKKVWAYSGTVFAATMIIGLLIHGILGVL